MRFAALDVGDVRIGIAVCDVLETAAFPIGTFRRVGSLKRDAAAIALLLAEQEADAVIVGLPFSLDGTVGTQAQKVQGFVRALERATEIAIFFWDESLSSVEANALMIAQGISRSRRREQIDQRAAAVILESFLAHRRLSGAARDALS